MTNATQAIIASLNEMFAPMDAEVLAATQVWAKARVAALREYRDSEQRKIDGRAVNGSYIVYNKYFALSGGKTWFHVFDGRSAAMIEEFVVKNCAAVAAKRNAGIAAKLDKAGVSQIVSTEFTRTTDGFNGIFIVMTDTGRKVVTVQTIRAGGYNIQCLHLRVLTHVK